MRHRLQDLIDESRECLLRYGERGRMILQKQSEPGSGFLSETPGEVFLRDFSAAKVITACERMRAVLLDSEYSVKVRDGRWYLVVDVGKNYGAIESCKGHGGQADLSNHSVRIWIEV